MNGPTDRPEPGGPSRSKRWAEDFGLFASDATERLGRFGQRLRVFNAGASQWVTTLSWTRLGLLGFIILIAAAIVGDITGWDSSQVQINPSDLRKPVDIVIHNDGKTVHIQPKVGGRTTRPIDIPVPDVPRLPDVPEGPGAPTTSSKPTASVTSRGIVVESDGKRIVIDQKGVRVLTAKKRSATRRPRRGAATRPTTRHDADVAAADLDAQKAAPTRARARRRARCRRRKRTACVARSPTT